MGRLAYAYEIDIGDRFRWQDKVYIVDELFDEDNNVDRLIVHVDGSTQKEFFNAYCFVEKVDAQSA